MNEQAEEKKLPASDKKLREARKQGQVSQSRDLISGFTLAGSLLFLFSIWPYLWERLERLVETVGMSEGATAAETTAEAIGQSIFFLFAATVPLMTIIVVLTLVFGIIGTFGPVFSFEAVKPRFEHINPAQGLKKIASLRNAIEFIKSIVKVAMLAGVFVFVLMSCLRPLFMTPACGPSCMAPMTMSVLIPFGAAAAVAFIVIGLLDLPIQRWLFLRDMRMTRTEYRREHKDIEGDPLIRQELRRQRRESVTQQTRLGLENATLAIVSEDRMVALRYAKGETPVPIIVGKWQGDLASSVAAEARRLHVPLAHDPALIEPLFNSTKNGTYIGQELFSPVVRHLVRLGLV